MRKTIKESEKKPNPCWMSGWYCCSPLPLYIHLCSSPLVVTHSHRSLFLSSVYILPPPPPCTPLEWVTFISVHQTLVHIPKQNNLIKCCLDFRYIKCTILQFNVGPNSQQAPPFRLSLCTVGSACTTVV